MEEWVERAIDKIIKQSDHREPGRMSDFEVGYSNGLRKAVEILTVEFNRD